MIRWHLNCLFITILLIMTSVFSEASPLPAQLSAERGSYLPPAVNGFQLTVDYWNELEKIAREVQSMVAILDNQASSSYPGNNPERIAYISSKLAEKYPGAKFDGKSGQVPVQNHLVASFGQDLKVTKITDIFSKAGKHPTKNYYILEQKFECNVGFNSIAGVINKVKPGNSEFTRVSFTDFQDAVEKLFSSTPDFRPVDNSAGVAVLNDGYLLLAQSQGMRMDTFAENFLLADDTYNSVLKNALTSYRERHTSGNRTAAAQKMVVNKALPEKSADQTKLWNVGSFFIGLFVIVTALILAIFYGVRWFYMIGRSNQGAENREMKKGYPKKKKNAPVPVTDKTDTFTGMNPAAKESRAVVDRYAESAVADAVEKAVAKVVWGQVADSLEETVAAVVEKKVAMAVDQALAGILEQKMAATAKPVPLSVPDAVVPVVSMAVKKQMTCVLCGKKMKLGTVTKGVQAGSKFWVCPDYPSCRNLVPLPPG